MPAADEAVWLPVLPSFKGFGPALSKGAGSEADKTGKAVGKRFGMALVAGTALVAGAGVAAVGALYKVGEVFDNVTETIRVGSGASGEALDGLVASAKNVGTKVPADFEKIGSTVADISTRMGLTGDTLETVASQYLEAGRILGEDIDIGKTSAAFNAFKIEGDKVSGAMDHLFQVSQATGIGMNELAAAASANAPAMNALGFSFEETTAMVGSFDKAGLNSSAIMASMSKGLVTLAKDGEEPAEAFKRVQGEIGEFIKAGDKAAALNLASEVFGTRGATQFIGALESGALNLEDMSKAAGQTGDTILGLGAETMDFTEQWQVFKNKVLVWLEPMGTRVFGALGTLMTELTGGVTAFAFAWKQNSGDITSSGIPGVMERLGFYARQAFDYIKLTVIPNLQSLGQWVVKNKDWLLTLGSAVLGGVVAFKAFMIVSTIVTFLRTYATVTAAATGAQKLLNLAMKANPIGLVITLVASLVAGLVWFFTQTETGRKVVTAVWGAIQTFIGGVVKWFQTYVLPTVQKVFKTVGDIFTWLWKNIIEPVFKGIGWAVNAWWQVVSALFTIAIGFIRDKLGAIFTWLYEKVIKPVFSWIGSTFSTAWTGWKIIFGAVVDFLKATLGPIFTWLYEKVIKPVWDGISKFISDAWSKTLKPVFDKFADIVRAIPYAFEAARDGISSAWNALMEIAKKPVIFVVDTVIGGLIDTFNTIPGVNITKPKLPASFYATPPASAPRRAIGGPVRERAKGGFTPPGWTLVGEEGPELVNFKKPGRVYTAKETRQALVQRDGGGSFKQSPTGAVPALNTGIPGIIASTGKNHAYVEDNSPGWFISQATSIISGLSALKLSMGRTGMPRIQTHVGSQMPGNVLGYATGNNVVFNAAHGGMAPHMKKAVAIHELLHVFGLGHTNGASIMQPSLGNYMMPTANDAREMTRLYGEGKGGATAGSAAVANPFSGLVDTLMGAFKKAFPGAGMFVDAAGGLAKSGIESVVKIVTDIQNGIKNLAGDIWGNIKDFFGGDSAMQAPLLHDQGGYLQPGLSTILNRTRKPEAILNQQQWADISKLALTDTRPSREIVIQGNVGWDPAEVARRIETAERRQRITEGVLV